MATADEVLKEMDNVSETNNDSPVCVIDPETRTITVPPEYQLLGVESDEKVERLYFQCPNIVGDNVDLSQLILFINYQNAGQEIDAYKITDVETYGDNITFSWLLDRKVTAYRTTQQNKLGFSFCAQKADDDGTLTQEWNTTVNTECSVLEGLEAQEHIEEENSSAIAQIWQAIDELKAGGGGSGTQGKDGREIELQKSSTAIQWRYVGDESWTDLVQLSEITGPKGDPGEGLPSGGTTGQVLTKNSDSDGDASWKNPSTVSDEQVKTAVDNYLEENPVQCDTYFELVKGIYSNTVVPEQPPTSYNGNDDWYYGNYGKPLYQETGKEQFYYKNAIFTGTVYIRCLTVNQYSTPGLYGMLAFDSNISPEQWTKENGNVETLNIEEKKVQFDLDDKHGFVFVNSDGSYEISPSSHQTQSNDNGYVVLLKYTIPEGKYGRLISSAPTNSLQTGVKWNARGYPAIFTINPVDNIVQDAFSDNSVDSEGQLQTKKEYTSGFMKFISENSEFQSYIADKINSFLPLTAKRQTYGKSIYIGGDSLHQYAGGDGKTTTGFVTNWNKYLGFSEVTNAGYAGSTWSGLTGGGGLKRAKDLISAGTVYDVIILAWGTNDDTGGNGTIDEEASDADGATMVAAMKWIITNLRNTFKNTSIGVIIPPPKNTDDGMKIKGDLMIQVCKLLHVPYVDMREYISISDLDGDQVHLGTGAGKYGAAEANLIMRICQYGDALYPGNSENT